MARPGSHPFSFSRISRKLPLLAVLVLLLVTGWRAYHNPATRNSRRGPHSEIVPDAPVSVRVRKVVDGDTIIVDGNQSVRLLGVDTPETVKPETPVQPWGPEATEFTRRHVEGQTVRLEFDHEKYDKYNRLLAYVYLDKWLLNEELIRAGLSPAVTKYPYSSAMKVRFRAAEDEARRQKLGIWSTP